MGHLSINDVFFESADGGLATLFLISVGLEASLSQTESLLDGENQELQCAHGHNSNSTFNRPFVSRMTHRMFYFAYICKDARVDRSQLLVPTPHQRFWEHQNLRPEFSVVCENLMCFLPDS